MKGYGQFCPIAKGAEIFAERWTPLLLRELHAGTRNFNDLQRGVPLMSRSLLSKRLKELEAAGILERRIGDRGPQYHLTQAGEALRSLVHELGAWGLRFARSDLAGDELDPRGLMWDMRRRINEDKLPSRRVVVRFEFTDVPRASLRRTWLVLDRDGVDVSYRDPGSGDDLAVTTTVHAMSLVWLGDHPFEAVRDAGLITVTGTPELAEVFPQWLALSTLAGVERPRRPLPVPAAAAP